MAVRQDNIPVKILKLSNDIFYQYLSQIFKESTEMADFQNVLKDVDITPVQKKKKKKQRTRQKEL